MAPIGAADKKNTNDIPVAYRAKRSRGLIRWAIAPTMFFVGLLLTFVLWFSPLNFFKSYFLKSTSGNLDPESALNDLRLLGHFPYPEAANDDLISIYPGLSIHKDTHKALNAMSSDAQSEGIRLVLLSGYRSHSLQEEIFFDLKSERNQTAIERARVSAPPGYSEHSTGYAIDLGDGTQRNTDFTVEFENTQAFKWLKKNAAKYHFKLSFPKGNTQGVSYEPWHWRFEGTADALRQFEGARRLLEAN